MRTRLGAWVARARLHARLGRPMPTNTTSPSASSRAATAAIISLGVYAGSETVVHSARVARLRLEPCGQPRLFGHVRRAVGEAADVFLQVALEPPGIARDPLSRLSEVVVTILIKLRLHRVCTTSLQTTRS